MMNEPMVADERIVNMLQISAPKLQPFRDHHMGKASRRKAERKVRDDRFQRAAESTLHQSSWWPQPPRDHHCRPPEISREAWRPDVRWACPECERNWESSGYWSGWACISPGQTT